MFGDHLFTSRGNALEVLKSSTNSSVHRGGSRGPTGQGNCPDSHSEAAARGGGSLAPAPLSPLPSSALRHTPGLPPNTLLPLSGPGCPRPLVLLPPAALLIVSIFNLARTGWKPWKMRLWLIIFSSRSLSKARREGTETKGPTDK